MGEVEKREDFEVGARGGILPVVKHKTALSNVGLRGFWAKGKKEFVNDRSAHAVVTEGVGTIHWVPTSLAGDDDGAEKAGAGRRACAGLTETVAECRLRPAWNGEPFTRSREEFECGLWFVRPCVLCAQDGEISADGIRVWIVWVDAGHEFQSTFTMRVAGNKP